MLESIIFLVGFINYSMSVLYVVCFIVGIVCSMCEIEAFIGYILAGFYTIF